MLLAGRGFGIAEIAQSLGRTELSPRVRCSAGRGCASGRSRSSTATDRDDVARRDDDEGMKHRPSPNVGGRDRPRRPPDDCRRRGVRAWPRRRGPRGGRRGGRRRVRPVSRGPVLVRGRAGPRPDPAEDLVAEAFARLVREVRAGRAPMETRGWLYRVVANGVRSRGRRLRTAQKFLGQLLDRRVEESPETTFVRGEVRDDLLDALQALAPDARTAVVMAARGSRVARSLRRSAAPRRPPGHCCAGQGPAPRDPRGRGDGMSVHRSWLELAAREPGFALDPDERAALDTHLAGCDDCAAVATGMRLDARRIGDLAVTPPARLRGEVVHGSLVAAAPRVGMVRLALLLALLAMATIGLSAGIGAIGSGGLGGRGPGAHPHRPEGDRLADRRRPSARRPGPHRCGRRAVRDRRARRGERGPRDPRVLDAGDHVARARHRAADQRLLRRGSQRLVGDRDPGQRCRRQVGDVPQGPVLPHGHRGRRGPARSTSSARAGRAPFGSGIDGVELSVAPQRSFAAPAGGASRCRPIPRRSRPAARWPTSTS